MYQNELGINTARKIPVKRNQVRKRGRKKIEENISSYRIMKFLDRENKTDCLISKGMYVED